MSSAMPKMLGGFRKISSILHWEMSATGTTLNGSLVNLYLPNQHVNVVKYDDYLSRLML